MAPAPSKPAPSGQAVPKKGPSLVVQGGLLVGLTVLAAGMGWFGGGTIKPAAPLAAPGSPAQSAKAEPAGHGEAKEGGSGEEAAAEGGGDPLIVPLPPITTNLAAPADTWLRVELALQFKEPPESGMADTIAGDFLGYLRTLKLHQLQGASSLLHLKADLDERAQIRSGGKTAQVFIRAMILE